MSLRIITHVWVMFLTIVVTVPLACQIQKTDTGNIDFYPDFPSAYVVPRHIEVWLPEHYSRGGKFGVVYMHDGQMLYDATTTWNKQSWNVDSTASVLMSTGKVKDCIIVGIWNDQSTRHQDYFPAKPFNFLTAEEKKWVTTEMLKSGRTTEEFSVYSDDYLRFIVKELKPFIDSVYHVNTCKENTFIVGSSMGGLISMYALLEHPDVFGGAACVSTHWPGVFTDVNNPLPAKFAEYIRMRLPELKGNTIYFDYGDQTLDAMYPPYQATVDQVMKDYPNELWTSTFFPGADHSEKAWSKRFGDILIYLCGKK